VSTAVLGPLRTAACLLVLASVLVGCGADDGEPAPPKRDALLSRADVAPLVPSAVTKLSELPAGTQYYSCSEERHSLTGKGWSFQGRDLRNTEENWAVDSVVLDNPDGDTASQIAKFRNQIDNCNSKEGANLVELDLGKDTYAYRSVTPDKRVDTVRAYALISPDRMVQVTVLGLDKHSAPDRISSLLDKAVQKAS
jgi:hypothetical protein